VSKIPDDLLYTSEHEYIARTADPNVVRVGINDYAQGELGDVVFVNLPKVGQRLAAHESFGTIEAVKAVSELYAPVSGEIVAINDRLDAEPALVNNSPYGDGWMVKVRLADKGELAQLLSAQDYRSHIGETAGAGGD